MGRLTSLPSLVPALRSSLAYLPQTTSERDRYRGDLYPWRAWYKTPRWRKLRIATFERDGFTCQMCGKIEGVTSLLVADHKVRHRGDETLFWSEANLQTLCKPCHDGAKQRIEANQRG
jgi:5-methylcytosine-specific restriction endonuclease McrA